MIIHDTICIKTKPIIFFLVINSIGESGLILVIGKYILFSLPLSITRYIWVLLICRAVLGIVATTFNTQYHGNQTISNDVIGTVPLANICDIGSIIG